MAERTVAAISTPAGAGGIAVIRISGEDAITVADKCFRAFSGKTISSLEGYSALYGEIINGAGDVIDDAVALLFRAPKSFTGENVVEFSVHGGQLVARDVLRLVLSNGAFSAENGEFTKRAFLNGKLDLARAESIMGIISAKNENALRISRAAKEGKLSKEIEETTEKLLTLAASFSVYADYPDEEIENLNPQKFTETLEVIEKSLQKLLSTYDTGKIIREGIDCCIVGKPNVGKSTLMNALCKSERSIVTDVAGTTRDIVESTINLDGITLNLSDTAGLHETDDVVEKAGVNKTLNRLSDASLILAVFDLSGNIDDDDIKLLNELGNNSIIILNKTDLTKNADLSVFGNRDTVAVSAKNNDGIDELTKIIKAKINMQSLTENDAVLLNERQFACVNRAFESIIEAKTAILSGVTLDAVGICIDDCLSKLLELVGKRVTNEVTDEVFRRFCVGK